VKVRETVKRTGLHHKVTLQFRQREKLITDIECLVEASLGRQHFAKAAEPLQAFGLKIAVRGRGQQRQGFVEIINRTGGRKTGARLLAGATEPFESICAITRLLEMASDQRGNFVDTLAAAFDEPCRQVAMVNAPRFSQETFVSDTA